MTTPTVASAPENAEQKKQPEPGGSKPAPAESEKKASDDKAKQAADEKTKQAATRRRLTR